MNESEVVALLGSPGDKYKGREAMAVLLAAMKKHGGLANPAVTLRVKYPPAFDALPKGEQKADASDSWTYGPYTGEEQTEKGKRRTETSLGVFFLDGKLTEARKHQILTAW